MAIGDVKPVPHVAVQPHVTEELTYWARWTGTGKQYVLSWGDGTKSPPRTGGQGSVSHTYPGEGAFMITAREYTQTHGESAILGSAQVFVRPGLAPVVTWAADADNPNFIIFDFADTPEDLVSEYRVDYGDGSQQETLWAPHGTTKTHGYRAGEYTVAVQDVHARRGGKVQVQVSDPEYDPDFTLSQGVDSYTAELEITRLVTPGKELLIDWGDYTQDTISAGEAVVGVKKTHKYTEATNTIVQCVYSDGSTDGSAQGIEIPWPAAKWGPKPTSMIIWYADALDPHAAWLRWFGSGGHYTIHWGDGQSTEMAFWQPPVKHVYAAAGVYDVVCVSGIRDDWTMSAQVVIRDSIKPEASFTLVEAGGNRVRANLASVSEPVRYRIDWGDNIITEHASNDLEPVHEYAWNTPAPTITVTDMPSRRGAKFAGPDIGPGPDADLDGFFFEYVSSSDDSRRFKLRGGGMTPGSTVTYYPHTLAWYRDAIADENGRINVDVDIPKSRYPEYDDRWRSYGIVGDNMPRQFVAVHPVRGQAGKPDVTYQVDIDDPNTLEFSVTPAMLGKHTIDFGDGTSKVINVTTLPLRIKHTYTKTSDITATITLPDGREPTRTVIGYTPADPCFNYHYPGSCSVGWYVMGWPEHSCPPGGSDGPYEYSPVIIDNGYHPPHQIHRPDNRKGWQVAYGYGMPIGRYVFKYTSTFTPTTDHPVNITKARFKYIEPPPIELVVLPQSQADISAWFGNVNEWDGGYSGTFYVTNNTDGDTAWAIEFSLADPAVLREVWPSGVEYADLGGGRWRIFSNMPLPHGGTVEVGARIEPPGKTKKFPDDITGKTRDPNPPGDSSG